ncbi:hypothetical protein IWQ60_009475 [Tieghemiomyces parasiticus]|uniref:Carboxypeptidase n=1 Tax=Tieghemiomyces parasiticus TaxID=78921 RepID=A0A9W8DJU4_9FUNG|nr:hypothetical protein IWQ60_009475 [Tieghemiomyces parasiticus]
MRYGTVLLIAAAGLLGTSFTAASAQLVFSHSENTLLTDDLRFLGEVEHGTQPFAADDEAVNLEPAVADDGEPIAVSEAGFTIAQHPAFPQYKLRIREPKLCDPTVQQYSGYLDVGSDKHFYFWFFESRDKPAEDPVLLWLNGGPGCSSLTGLMMELGPCRLHEDGSLTHNPHSWNNHANLLFLDQPTNVGYSYGRSVFNTATASEDVYAFLQLFFKQYTKYAELPFHVFGESYGGHFVPAIGGKIFAENQRLQEPVAVSPVAGFLRDQGVQVINLASLGIGNGLVDELVQYKYYHTMACNSSYGPVLSDSACQQMAGAYPSCGKKIQQCYKTESALSCVPAAFDCNRRLIGPYQSSGLNPYDVRLPCEDGNLCYPLIGAIEKYFNRPEVMRELGADVDSYKGCNMNVNLGFNLAGDWMKPYMRYLPPLLEAGIRVLVYAGDADFICNWYGNKAWTLDLEWSGRDKFRAAEDRDWTLAETKSTVNPSYWASLHSYSHKKGKHHKKAKKGAKPVGEVRSHENFTFLRIFGAGHMAPYDQPESSSDMIDRWLAGSDL